MKTLLIFIALMLLIGCTENSPTTNNYSLTIGIDQDIPVYVEGESIHVESVTATSTSSELYFYLPEGLNYKAERISIPDCLTVDGYTFTRLSVLILKDALGNWYAQFSRGDICLSMSVGAEVVISEFTINFTKKDGVK